MEMLFIIHLCSLYLHHPLAVPDLAITGTATRQMPSDIVKQLAMGENALTINISPNRDIRFTLLKCQRLINLNIWDG